MIAFSYKNLSVDISFNNSFRHFEWLLVLSGNTAYSVIFVVFLVVSKLLSCNLYKVCLFALIIYEYLKMKK